MTNYEQIKKDVIDIINKYKFEFNTDKVRKSLCNDLSLYLNENVVDRTTPEMVDNGYICPKIVGDYIEIDLESYLENLIIKERKRKIEKIRRIMNKK